MSDKEILEKAIQEALNNGWGAPPWIVSATMGEYKYKWEESEFTTGWVDYDDYISVRDIIYNHSFAKAIWGGKFINPEMRDDKGSKVIAIQQTAWRHHLRQMVTSDNPIKYLGENI